jgi:hypothetical protein
MDDVLRAIVSRPFLLVQVGPYGQGYENMRLPSAIAALAAEREKQGEPTYPKNERASPPHYCIPADVDGILMNKIDELHLNGVAYWAQNLNTRIGPHGCINSNPGELCSFAREVNPFWALLVTKQGSTPPKGSPPGNVFKRWTIAGNKPEPPTCKIDRDIVYTESKQPTLVFRSLERLDNRETLDLNEFHIHFTGDKEQELKPCYRGKRLPYRSSSFGTCSLSAP